MAREEGCTCSLPPEGMIGYRRNPDCPVHGGPRPRQQRAEERRTQLPQPTWREAILSACEGVGKAEAERARVLQAATDAGLSTRQIAAVAGVAPSTVWRWIGGKGEEPRPSLLDAPARLP